MSSELEKLIAKRDMISLAFKVEINSNYGLGKNTIVDYKKAINVYQKEIDILTKTIERDETHFYFEADNVPNGIKPQIEEWMDRLKNMEQKFEHEKRRQINMY